MTTSGASTGSGGTGRTKAASVADELVLQFTREIEQGALGPGARFPTEKSITEQFGVSRTVVREAFARLAAQGLLESRRGAGAFVALNAGYRAFQIVPEELAEIDDVLKLLEMRMGLETEMAGLAAERRTRDHLRRMRVILDQFDASTDLDLSMQLDSAFHAEIAQATGNDYYVRFMEFLGLRLVPPRRLYLKAANAMSAERYLQEINAEHRAILAAIRARDPQAAREAARMHMQVSYQRHAQMKSAYTG